MPLLRKRAGGRVERAGAPGVRAGCRVGQRGTRAELEGARAGLIDASQYWSTPPVRVTVPLPRNRQRAVIDESARGRVERAASPRVSPLGAVRQSGAGTELERAGTALIDRAVIGQRAAERHGAAARNRQRAGIGKGAAGVVDRAAGPRVCRLGAVDQSGAGAEP